MAKEIEKRDQAELTPEELDALQAEGLPDRENMSVVEVNAAVPVNAAVAANVLTDHSTASSSATQTGSIHQPHHR